MLRRCLRGAGYAPRGAAEGSLLQGLLSRSGALPPSSGERAAGGGSAARRAGPIVDALLALPAESREQRDA
eukprot:gene20577-38925_t